MADELDPNEVVTDGVDTSVEDELAGQRTPKTVEDFARERGWRPKEEYDGASEWRDAETFLAYGLDRTRDLGRDVKELRSTIDNISRTTGSIMEQRVQEARREEREALQRQLVDATEAGDTGKVIEVSQKIAEHAAQPVRPAQPTPGDDPAVASFVSENTWFTSDDAAKAVAVATAGKIAASGGSVADQLKAAKEAVFKRFPEYAPAGPAPAKVIDVAQPSGRLPDTKRNGKKSFTDLNSEEQTVAKMLVQQGRLKSVDEYVAHRFNPQGAVE